MKDNNCIFCKLANGEIPTATIYEDEDFRVILDANPAAKGHALILPKEHYANLYELDDELAGKSMILAKKMITKLQKHWTVMAIISSRTMVKQPDRQYFIIMYI